MLLGEGNQIGRVSRPRDFRGVSPFGQEQVHDALGSVERRDVKRCPSLLVLRVDVCTLRKKRTRQGKRPVGLACTVQGGLPI